MPLFMVEASTILRAGTKGWKKIHKVTNTTSEIASRSMAVRIPNGVLTRRGCVHIPLETILHVLPHFDSSLVLFSLPKGNEWHMIRNLGTLHDDILYLSSETSVKIVNLHEKREVYLSGYCWSSSRQRRAKRAKMSTGNVHIRKYGAAKQNNCNSIISFDKQSQSVS